MARTPAAATPTGPITTVPTGTPDWWQNKKGTDTFGTAANALIPYLSPTDQANVAQQLGNKYASAFGSYLNNTQQAFSGSPGAGDYNYFMGQGRAAQALSTLNNMMPKGTTAPGPGYQYLLNVLNNMQRFGGGAQGSISREGFQQLASQASSQATDLKNSLSSKASKAALVPQFEGLANSFAFPSFNARGISPVTVLKGGRTVYGQPNVNLFE